MLLLNSHLVPETFASRDACEIRTQAISRDLCLLRSKSMIGFTQGAKRREEDCGCGVVRGRLWVQFQRKATRNSERSFCAGYHASVWFILQAYVWGGNPCPIQSQHLQEHVTSEAGRTKKIKINKN